MLKIISITVILLPMVAEANGLKIESNCPLTIGLATFSFIRSMGLDKLSTEDKDYLVTINNDNKSGSGFESTEIVCNDGRPIVGMYFVGENPKRADVIFASKVGEKVFKPWDYNIDWEKLRRSINACLSTRPAEWSPYGTKEGQKITIGELETWCDSIIWDNQNQKSPISTKISIAVSE